MSEGDEPYGDESDGDAEEIDPEEAAELAAELAARRAELEAELQREAEEFGLTTDDPTILYGPKGNDVRDLLDSLRTIHVGMATGIADAYDAVPEADYVAACRTVRRERHREWGAQCGSRSTPCRTGSRSSICGAPLWTCTAWSPTRPGTPSMP